MKILNQMANFLGFCNSQSETENVENEIENVEEQNLEDDTIEEEITDPLKKEKEEEILEDVTYHNPLSRPLTWDDYIGESNKHIIDRLKIEIEAGKISNSNLNHILFYGSAGTGKTTLARIIANETKAKLFETVGGVFKKQLNIYRLMCDIKIAQLNGHKVILFIDEIHDIAQYMPETTWYPILEEGVFNHGLRGTKFSYSNSEFNHTEEGIISDTKFTLEPITIIGATTDPGLLTDAMIRRFPIQCRLRKYTETDLTKIILSYSTRNKIEITNDAAENIAKRSRNTPAEALNLLNGCKSLAIVNHCEITENLVNQQMDFLNIDEEGLKEDDITTLELLAKTEKGLGVSNLASNLSVRRETITNIIEPFLKQKGLMEVTTRRFITDKGREYLRMKGAIS